MVLVRQSRWLVSNILWLCSTFSDTTRIMEGSLQAGIDECDSSRTASLGWCGSVQSAAKVLGVRVVFGKREAIRL